LLAGQGDTGDVAAMSAELLGLGLGGLEVDVVDLEIGAAEEAAAAGRQASDAHGDAGPAEVLDEFQFVGVGGHGKASAEQLVAAFARRRGEAAETCARVLANAATVRPVPLGSAWCRGRSAGSGGCRGSNSSAG